MRFFPYLNGIRFISSCRSLFTDSLRQGSNRLLVFCCPQTLQLCIRQSRRVFVHSTRHAHLSHVRATPPLQCVSVHARMHISDRQQTKRELTGMAPTSF